MVYFTYFYLSYGTKIPTYQKQYGTIYILSSFTYGTIISTYEKQYDTIYLHYNLVARTTYEK